jgi:hypothetical protein
MSRLVALGSELDLQIIADLYGLDIAIYMLDKTYPHLLF